MNNQQINWDALEGAIRNPIQHQEVVGRALRGSVCSLPLLTHTDTWGPLPYIQISVYGGIGGSGSCILMPQSLYKQ